MKKFNKNSIRILAASFALGLIAPIAVFAAGPAAINLNSAGNYVILSKTAITTTGVTSITGDIGVSPAAASAMTGFGQAMDVSNTFSTSALVTGKLYASDYAVPTPATLSTAVSDMQAAYVDGAGRTPGVGATNLNLGSGTLSGQNLVPGTYTWGSDVGINGDVTFTGAASDIWILQISGNLSIEANKKIILAGGALPQNIFWVVAGTTTIKPGANFSGIILAGPGASTIAMQSGAVLNGRALGQTDVTLIANTISAVSSGPAPAVAVARRGRITPLIGILKVPTPLALSAGTGSVTYNYTVWNVGGQQALNDVTVVDDKCSPVTFVSGDTNGNGQLDPNEKWNYSCTMTLSNTTTNTAIATGYSDDAYHQAAIATAISTVVVSTPTAASTPVVPLPAPILSVVEVPNILTSLPFGGSDITYTYTVKNPGVVAVHNVTLTDDKCSPATFVSGDTNSNGLLDTNETWMYTCKTNVQISTASVATVKGNANALPALAYAFTNVLVAVPDLPNTGLPNEAGNTSIAIIILSALLIVVSTALVVVLKKQKV